MSENVAGKCSCSSFSSFKFSCFSFYQESFVCSRFMSRKYFMKKVSRCSNKETEIISASCTINLWEEMVKLIGCFIGLTLHDTMNNSQFLFALHLHYSRKELNG